MHTKLFNCSSYKVVISCNCYCGAPIWLSYEPFNTHVPTYVYEALCLTAQLKALNLYLLWMANIVSLLSPSEDAHDELYYYVRPCLSIISTSAI